MNHVEEAAGGHGQRREQQGAPRVGDIGVTRGRVQMTVPSVSHLRYRLRAAPESIR